MDIELLQQKFGRLGTRVQITKVAGRRSAGIDIRADKKGEYFDIRIEPNDPVDYEVVDLQPEVRHLLLLARRENSRKEKYLCGRDERHWFVCAVPERQGVASVVAAMQALQPAEVRAAVARTGCRTKDHLRRHTQAFVRQGEWFFIPSPDVIVNTKLVHRNEPISRGQGSKPHMCQFLYRDGGEIVMVCSRYPSGVTIEQYHRIVKAKPVASRWNWVTMQRNAAAYVRGRVSHPDHKTIGLDGWHRVLMNTENEAPAKRNVVFLD